MQLSAILVGIAVAEREIKSGKANSGLPQPIKTNGFVKRILCGIKKSGKLPFL